MSEVYKSDSGVEKGDQAIPAIEQESVLSKRKAYEKAVEETVVPEKLQELMGSAWGAARDQLGVPNNQRLAELLYESLYEPAQIEGEIKAGKIKNRPGMDRQAVLRAGFPEGVLPLEGISSDEEKQACKKKFIDEVCWALTTGTNIEKCLYPGAAEIVSDLAKRGPVTIWTTGDVYGIAKKPKAEASQDLAAAEESVELKKYGGSYEQYKRVSTAGLGRLREKIAEELGHGKQYGKELLSVSASEKKSELLPGILEGYRGKGMRLVVLLEDRAENITKALDEAKNFPEMTIFPIWVRQGISRNVLPQAPLKTLEEWQEELHAVETVAEVGALLRGYLEDNNIDPKTIASIVDFDDVLSNDLERQVQQGKALTYALRHNKWIA